MYYNSDEPKLSDQEFDRIKDELEELDPDNAFLREVGAPTDSALTKVKHKIPMGSLKKITTRAGFDTWLATVGKTASSLECLTEYKLDGVSIELLFKDGKFVQAITRGDGEIGEDVTHSIKNAKGFPNTISVKTEVSVRCEALLLIKDWKKHLSDKSNPRNAVSGLVRRTDGQNSQYICCVAFDVLMDKKFVTEADRIKWLKSEKFFVTWCKVTKPGDVETLVKDLEKKRAELPFLIDGAVVKEEQLSPMLLSTIWMKLYVLALRLVMKLKLSGLAMSFRKSFALCLKAKIVRQSKLKAARLAVHQLAEMVHE